MTKLENKFWAHRKTHRRLNRQKYVHTDRQIDRGKYRQNSGHNDRQNDLQIDGQAHRAKRLNKGGHKQRRTDRKTDRQTDGQRYLYSYRVDAHLRKDYVILSNSKAPPT